MDRPNGNSARRRQEFKKGVDLEESRRRRGNDIVAQRKNKREENLQKKRLTALEGVGAAPPPPDTSSSTANPLAQTVFLLTFAARQHNASRSVVRCSLKRCRTWYTVAGVIIRKNSSKRHRSSERSSRLV